MSFQSAVSPGLKSKRVFIDMDVLYYDGVMIIKGCGVLAGLIFLYDFYEYKETNKLNECYNMIGNDWKSTCIE